MEDKKGPGDGPGDGKSKPDMKVGDARISKTSLSEIEQKKAAAAGSSVEYTLSDKTLVPKTKEEHAKYRKDYAQMAPEKADAFLKQNEWKGGDISPKVALSLINRLAEIADEKGYTSPNDIKKAKATLINESGNENGKPSKENQEYKVTSDTWDALNKKGNLAEVIHRINREKKAAAGPVKFRLGSVGAGEPTGPVKQSDKDSKEMTVEDSIDKAFRYVKDEKGNITKVSK